MTTELYDSIVRVFKETGSIAETAKRLNTYPIKIRRVLISEGLWSSKSSRQITKLLGEGKGISEISRDLGIEEKSVQAYLPYSHTREYWNQQKSRDAINTENYRKRNSSIASNKKRGSDERRDSEKILPAVHSKKTIMKLHLELGLEDEWLPVLKKYGRVKNGISRDILVPSDMTLLALHYTIQRAFGWQEGHMHSFELDYDRFFDLIHNSIGRWSSFCGLYFRFPIPSDCYYWDDDYTGQISYKNWLKQQYTGPYKYCGTLEHLVECKRILNQCITDNPFFNNLIVEGPERDLRIAGSGDDQPVIIKTSDSTAVFSWGEINVFLERLSIGEILFPIGQKRDEVLLDELLSVKWTSHETDPEVTPITDSLMYDYWGLDWTVKITCTEQYDIHSGVPGFENEMGKLQRGPICIDYDGLPLMEDADGSSFCEFLEQLHSDDPEQRKSAKNEAKESGWTGYRVKPENLL